MAILSYSTHRTLSHSLSSAFRHSLSLQEPKLSFRTHRLSLRKLTLIASSSKNSRVSVKAKTGRSVKSNEELCAEIREFVSMVGLPEGHVPSLNELLEHGRKDLANVVRRRGYKRITELLTHYTNEDANTRTIAVATKEASCSDEVVGQEQKLERLAEDLSLSSGGSNMKSCLSYENGFLDLVSSTQNHESIESPASLSFQEKAAKFVQYGELDTVEDTDDAEEVSYVIQQVNEEKNSAELDSEVEVEVGAVNGKSFKQESSGNNTTSAVNTSASTSEMVEYIAADEGRDDTLSSEGLNNVHSHEEPDIESNREVNQAEINRLKAMLHDRELELSQLKEQIEKEKFALSALQAKAEFEIDKAQRTISAKDEELQTAEENLSGLKEVQIEYWGNGQTVDVAGSFNGWHQHIKMDPHPSPSVMISIESRKSRLWSTILLLYPGKYEIKFIVDGEWRIDPQRELVSKGSIQNNILRVE